MNEKYYVAISGVQYDRKMIECAERAARGGGDGRIAIEDAMALLGFIKDENVYSDVEKATVNYIRDNYSFTQAADHLFQAEIRKWTATQ